MAKETKNILLVDDDADDQLLFRNALNQIDSNVNLQTASNGAVALKQIEVPPPPDLIFLDLNMPVMNGYECLKALKGKEPYKNIPVVIFTTTNDHVAIEETRQMGASAFFHKPIEFDNLRERLHRVLGFIDNGSVLENGKLSFVF